MKRVLVVHPVLRPHGGGQAVAAWTLESLKGVCDLSLFTSADLDYAGINRFFGTTLKSGDFKVYRTPVRASAALRHLPIRADLLSGALNQRWLKRLLHRHEFDVILGTHNEMDFGQPGIQYVHFPWGHIRRPETEMRWYHLAPAVLFYRAACARIGGISIERLRSNVTLANSAFIADLIRQAHGIEARILPPPVPADFPHVPWSERRDAFVGIGRLHQEKKWDQAVEIVRRVRQSGRDAQLTLILTPEKKEPARMLHALARSNPWLTLREAVPRRELVRIVAEHRYGIHPMDNEHFGIGPAELQLAGCLPFVHRSGGPAEIVGREDLLMFGGADEAVSKILNVMGDRELQSTLRERAAQRAGLYTQARFQLEIRKLVDEFPAAAMRRNSALR